MPRKNAYGLREPRPSRQPHHPDCVHRSHRARILLYHQSDSQPGRRDGPTGYNRRQAPDHRLRGLREPAHHKPHHPERRIWSCHKNITFEFSTQVESSDGFVLSELAFFEEVITSLAPGAGSSATGTSLGTSKRCSKRSGSNGALRSRLTTRTSPGLLLSLVGDRSLTLSGPQDDRVRGRWRPCGRRREDLRRGDRRRSKKGG